MAIEEVGLLLNDDTPIGIIGQSTCYFETKPIDAGDDKQEKFWEGILVEVEGVDLLKVNMQVSFATKDRLKDDWTWYGPWPLLSSDSPIWFPTPTEGGPPSSRYGAVKVEDTQIAGIWALTAIEIFGSGDGGRM